MLNLRNVEKGDVADILECEKATWSRMDPDFFVPTLPDWAWDEAKLMESIRKYEGKGTRTFVAESVRADDQGLETFWVCGCVCFEILPDRYEALLLTVHPEAPGETLSKLVRTLTMRADRSQKRPRVVVRVPDADYATVNFFQERNWKVKLLCGHYSDGTDAWECVYIPENAQ